MPKRDHGKLAVSWWPSNPTTGPNGTAATWVGIEFGVEVPGRLAGFRAYINSGEDGNSEAKIWIPGIATNLQVVQFGIRATSGNQWHQAWFRPWVRLSTTETYRFAMIFPHGKFWRTNNALTSAVRHGNITFNKGFQTTSLTPELATISLVANANAVDILYYED